MDRPTHHTKEYFFQSHSPPWSCSISSENIISGWRGSENRGGDEACRRCHACRCLRMTADDFLISRPPFPPGRNLFHYTRSPQWTSGQLESSLWPVVRLSAPFRDAMVYPSNAPQVLRPGFKHRPLEGRTAGYRAAGRHSGSIQSYFTNQSMH